MSPINHYWAATLVPWHVVKSLKLVWRSSTRRWNLRVPDHQMSCCDLTLKIGHQDSSPSNDCQGDMPYLKAYEIIVWVWFLRQKELQSQNCTSSIRFLCELFSSSISLNFPVNLSGTQKMISPLECRHAAEFMAADACGPKFVWAWCSTRHMWTARCTAPMDCHLKNTNTKFSHYHQRNSRWK